MPGLPSANVSTSATGTARGGGGNVFNAAPLFGSQIGNSMGSGGQAGASALSNPFVLGGLVLLALAAIVAFVLTRK